MYYMHNYITHKPIHNLLHPVIFVMHSMYSFMTHTHIQGISCAEMQGIHFIHVGVCLSCVWVCFRAVDHAAIWYGFF
jgi:hypothetical protein